MFLDHVQIIYKNLNEWPLAIECISKMGVEW